MNKFRMNYVQTMAKNQRIRMFFSLQNTRIYDWDVHNVYKSQRFFHSHSFFLFHLTLHKISKQRPEKMKKIFCSS